MLPTVTPRPVLVAVAILVVTPAAAASLGLDDPAPRSRSDSVDLAERLATTPLGGRDLADALDELACPTRDPRPLDDPCREAPADGAAAVGGRGELTVWGTMETPSGPATVLPVGEEGHVRVHQGGEVAWMAADGTLRWRRPGMGLQHDWPIRHHVLPVVPSGADPTDPVPEATDDAAAVGDLTGDGVRDVAVTHLVPGDAPGLPASLVTVFDGTDGRTLWVDRVAPSIVHLAIDDGQLRVADRPPDANRSRIRSLTFETGDDGLTARVDWTIPGPPAPGRWLDLEPAGPDRIVATAALGHDGQTGGEVASIDTADGRVVWTHTTETPARRAGHDAGRGEIVVDRPEADGTGYTLQTLTAADGEPVASWHREEALLLDLERAGAGGAAWWVADVTLEERDAIVSTRLEVADGRVAAWTPGEGASWQHRRDGASFVPYTLADAQGRVLVTAADGPASSSSSLRALEAGTGEVAWILGDDPLHPLSLAIGEVQGRPAAVGAGVGMGARAFDIDDGARLLDVPVPYDIRASAVHDVDRDGIDDLLVGGGSRAVHALDTETLDPVPDVHWSRRVDGAVHALHLRDLTPAPGPELLVVATGGLHVLDPDDGHQLHAIDTGAYTWTATVDDLDGDGGPEVVVPTRNLTAYDTQDGTALWTVSPPVEARFSTAAIAPDGTVGVQAVVEPPGSGGPVPVKKPSNWGRKALAFDGATGELAWAQPMPDSSLPRLWRSVIHHPQIAGTEGHGLAFVHAERADDALDPDRDRGLGVSMPRTRIDVYDARDGTSRWHAQAPWYFGHQGVVYLDGLVEHNNLGTVRPRPDGSATQTNYLADDAADRTNGIRVTDLARVRTGDGPVVAMISGGLFVYPDGTTRRDHAPPTLRLDAWGGAFRWGSMTVASLDGDDRDEIVLHPRDDDAYHRVIGWRGVQVLPGGDSPQALAVLGFGDPPGTEAGPAGSGEITPTWGLVVVASVGVAAAVGRRWAS